MTRTDLILLHPPSIYGFRELPIFHGPISDVIPSSSIFENYPIGFLTLSEYLNRRGISVRIVNLAMKMLSDASFDPDSFLAKLDPVAFGIDLHWLPSVDGSLTLAEVVKRQHPRTPVIFGGLSASYDAALKLIELKVGYGALAKEDGEEITRHIRRAQELMRRLQDAAVIDPPLKAEIFELNRLAFLCDKHELEWPIRGWKLKLLNVLKLLLGRY